MGGAFALRARTCSSPTTMAATPKCCSSSAVPRTVGRTYILQTIQGIIEVKLDPSSLQDALLLKKDYQAAKAIDITDTTLVLDPSMPRKRVTCPKYRGMLI